ncbi:MAG: DUF4336 domain-containing protein, partial [Cyanobacteriota bacterium]|nr:DUF4336 domain-containing protein [Cyanobacteriota bacterium]
ELAIISPIDIDRDVTQELDRLGTVKHIIAPNLFHYLFLETFKTLYPQAKIYAPSKLQAKIPNLSLDSPLENRSDYFSGELEYFLFAGVNTWLPSGKSPLNEYVFFHRESQTLILTDTAFYISKSFSPILQGIARVWGGYEQLRPSVLEKLATTEKVRVRRSAQTLLKWDFKRAIVAHGSIVERDAKWKFQEGYQWFLDELLERSMGNG